MSIVSICSSKFGNKPTGYCSIISSLPFFKGDSWKRGRFNAHVSTYLAKIERLLLLEGMRPRRLLSVGPTSSHTPGCVIIARHGSVGGLELVR